jgi:cyclohexadienyl dehydratase
MKNRSLILAALILILCAASTIICCTKDSNDTEADNLEIIRNRGTLIIGTTGDYRPLSYCEPATGEYWGFGIEVARKIAENIGVKATFVQTSWPTLTEDVLKEPAIFDFAIGGITITDARKTQMDMSDGYLRNGKTILCRKEDAQKYQTLDDLNRPEVRVMINPGGLNEKFARENLPQATLIVYEKNEEIPSQVSEGKADVMITEITEAPYYIKTDPRLAAPLLNAPFTHGEIGVLMQKNKPELLAKVNAIILQMKQDGTLKQLHEKFGLVYGY